ncbi:MAG: NAD(P)-dependent oxidoreductase, partial [Neisseriaceae bacterium]|nr:NAD(P)-dependent oxidoreductase [Neisseriaceae bacterium]
LHSKSTKHLLELLDNQPNRIIFVGGAGSLYVNPEHTVQLSDTPDFPDDYKPVAKAMGEAFELIKKANSVNWTYLSPAPMFNADGKRTGSYQLGKDEVIVNSQGEPAISYADYAIALVDEIENKKFPQQRFTAVSG